MTRPCAEDVSERLHLARFAACENPAEWDLIVLLDGSTPGRLAAVCEDHLSSRLTEWYDSGKYLKPESRQNIIVRPYDAAFIDPDEQEYVESLKFEIERYTA